MHLYREHSGLSPLARGTRAEGGSLVVTRRFIPAGAGNTPEKRYQLCVEPVYPRWRGEHRFSVSYLEQLPGLSPLARGTLGDLLPDYMDVRFIPAGAGNTPGENYGTKNRSVYPRWRGEHDDLIMAKRIADGLSPLARGTRVDQS